VEAKEAAAVLDGVIESLRSKPGQFNINVNVTTAGAIGIGGSGGAGIIGISNGGGTGFSATASVPSAAQIHIAQQQGLQQLSAEMSTTIESLEKLKAELLSTHPDRHRIRSFLSSLSGKWLPEVIIQVVVELTKLTLGGI
jgi:hypothetical protein